MLGVKREQRGKDKERRKQLERIVKRVRLVAPTLEKQDIAHFLLEVHPGKVRKSVADITRTRVHEMQRPTVVRCGSM